MPREGSELRFSLWLKKAWPRSVVVVEKDVELGGELGRMKNT